MLSDPRIGMLGQAKLRARKKGFPFSLQVSDIDIPDACPVLGIALRRGSGRLQDNSPTPDRIDNDKGYVKGNVIVISYKANRMKSNATPDEVRLLAAWLDKVAA